MEMPEASVFSNLYFNEKAARESLFVWADKLASRGGEHAQILGTYVLQMLHAECNIALHLTTNSHTAITFVSDNISYPRGAMNAPIVRDGICCDRYLWSVYITEMNSGSNLYELRILLNGLQYID